jgi:hypothetical protein
MRTSLIRNAKHRVPSDLPRRATNQVGEPGGRSRSADSHLSAGERGVVRLHETYCGIDSSGVGSGARWRRKGTVWPPNARPWRCGIGVDILVSAGFRWHWAKWHRAGRFQATPFAGGCGFPGCAKWGIEALVNLP